MVNLMMKMKDDGHTVNSSGQQLISETVIYNNFLSDIYSHEITYIDIYYRATYFFKYNNYVYIRIG